MNGWEIFNIFLRTYFSSKSVFLGAAIIVVALIGWLVYETIRRKDVRLLAMDLEKIDQLVKDNPNSTSLLIERATIQIQLGFPRIALSDLESAFEKGAGLDQLHDLFWVIHGHWPKMKIQYSTAWDQIKTIAPSLAASFRQEFETVDYQKLLRISTETDLNEFRRLINHNHEL